MASVAALITWIALAGALVSFVLGAAWSAQATRRQAPRQRRGARWLTVVAWPFALKRVQAAAHEQSERLNKALVAMIACLMIAAAAWSAAANLHRFAR
jgi:hypothetical protein